MVAGHALNQATDPTALLLPTQGTHVYSASNWMLLPALHQQITVIPGFRFEPFARYGDDRLGIVETPLAAVGAGGVRSVSASAPMQP